MKNIYRFKPNQGWIFMLILLLFVINSCKKEIYTQSTTDDVNITGYLELYPEQFSLMTEILDRSGTSGYLGAYGTYTLFTPDNAAIKAWLVQIGKASVADVSVEDLKSMVKFHLLADTVGTEAFTDGKLPELTLYGQYLITGAINENGSSSYLVNRQAKISKPNVRVGNGVMHVIDHVLLPSTKTLAKMIEENSRYSIFTQALKETGFYDSLNVEQSQAVDTLKRFQTAIIESDSALNVAGISNYAQLKARLSHTSSPQNHNDSLWLYVAYHIIPGANYMADITETSALYTLAPREIITSKFVGQTILLNDDDFNGVHEPGVAINRTFSDLTTSNGVIHDSKDLFKIKVRFQVPLFWEITDQPEISSQGSIWRKPTGSTYVLTANGASLVAAYQFERPSAGQTPKYVSTTATNRYFSNSDYLSMSMIGTTNTARNVWFELRTPMLVKGKYKVWACYGQHGTGPILQAVFDKGTSMEQTMPTLLDCRQTLEASGVTSAGAALPNADNDMQSQGFKRYMAHTNETNADGIKGSVPQSGTGWAVNPSRLLGTVDIQTTDRHWIRFTHVGGGSGQDYTWIDMIHLIPLNDDQLYPRFHKTAAIFKRP